MPRKADYTSKKYTGKVINALINQNAYKSLIKQKNKKGFRNTTNFLEYLILSNDDKVSRIDQIINNMLQLINFNKKLYDNINTTENNINQIAYRLNVARIENTLEQEVSDDVFKQEIARQIGDYKELSKDLRILLTTLIKEISTNALFQSHNKENQSKRKDSDEQ